MRAVAAVVHGVAASMTGVAPSAHGVAGASKRVAAACIAVAASMRRVAAFATAVAAMAHAVAGTGMARLLTLLLLYQAGFHLGRYVSLEKIVERSKESYYDTLHRSSQGWHEGRHSLVPWLEYYLGVLNAAYKEFEERVGELTAARGAKTQLVLDAIHRLPGRFRMVDVERLCPNVTREMIRVVLRRLRSEGKVRCEGAGVAAVWLKGGSPS